MCQKDLRGATESKSKIVYDRIVTSEHRSLPAVLLQGANSIVQDDRRRNHACQVTLADSVSPWRSTRGGCLSQQRESCVSGHDNKLAQRILRLYTWSVPP